MPTYADFRQYRLALIADAARKIARRDRDARRAMQYGIHEPAEYDAPEIYALSDFQDIMRSRPSADDEENWRD